MAPTPSSLAPLAELVRGDLTVFGMIRTLDLRSSGGMVRLKVKQSALGQLLDKRFARRALRLDVDTRELDTVWRVEDGGGHSHGEAVHRFPYNTPFAEGAPSGRGFELRDDAGLVFAHTDQIGRFLRTVLVVRDAAGVARVHVRPSSLRSRLTFERPEGEALLDLTRGSTPGERWRTIWVKRDLEPAQRELVGAALVLALLWV
ncbi:MAG: hypothetical protein P1V51_18840 [Deltaproteobacteria bacterium]|nr:hypothetical protein [Deltaproteobacteria bacterium]